MELTLITSFTDELENEWNELLESSVMHVPFLRYEYLRAWWETRGGGEWAQAELVLVTARQDGRLIGAAPLFYVPDYQGRPALLLVGSIEISDYLDLVAREEDMPAFLAALLPFLAALPNIPWKALDFYNFLDCSPTPSFLAQAAEKMGWAFRQETLQHSPFITLPGDWETYLAGIDKKQRHEIRRKMRRAEESTQHVRWYFAEDTNTLDMEIEAFMDLMAQDADKARFLTPPMRDHMRITTRCAFDRGCLKLAFMEIDGKKAAAYLAFDYLNRFWLYNSGIDWGFDELSPGWVLLGDLLKWANENGYSEFDFMRGDEKYKYRFGATDRFVLRTVIERA